ncbi:MAG: hypothetical protein KC416_04185 [Myxococcales bacterium]|nr:hypothetical protein [Myxococcales bacterium]
MQLVKVHTLTVLCVLAAGLWSTPAQAGGYEFSSLGTKPLGRGGAVRARPDEIHSLLYNPANLAALSGMQLQLGSSLAFMSGCYTRSSTPANNVSDGFQGGEETVFDPAVVDDPATAPGWPSVCNDGPPVPLPTLLFAARVNPWLGIGGGLLVPNAVGITSWAESGIVNVGGTDVPAPNRYMLLDENIIVLYPSIGAGIQVMPGLRLGATLQWGMAFVDFTNHTAIVGGQNPAQDTRTTLSVKDLFMPGVILSAQATPHENFDVAFTFRWLDDVDAGGTIDFETGTYGDGATVSPRKTTIEGAGFDAPLPWSAALALRYADRIAPRPEDPSEVERLSGRVEDEMANERWDIELDVVYEANSAVESFDITVPAGSEVALPDGTPIPITGPNDKVFSLPHRWKDQWTFHLGGDYNVLPGLAALRLGLSMETRGWDKAYAQLDFMPALRFGVHGGLTIRLGRFDVSMAYAHIFQETTQVSSSAAYPQLTSLPPADVINAGTYEADFDVLALGVTWHL